jgi:hypothetical protein
MLYVDTCRTLNAKALTIFRIILIDGGPLPLSSFFL